jgi:hypothetical protein
VANQVNALGAALVKVDAGTGLEIVGYTRNGADISERQFVIDVPGDENGGDEGPPIEIQDLGQIAHIRLEFTKWDPAVIDKIRARLKGGTAGSPAAAGTLVFAGSKDFRLLVHTTTRPMNFPRVTFREPIEHNMGTKYAILTLEGTAYKDGNGVLWNATTTG